jgi:hypothetical protein
MSHEHINISDINQLVSVLDTFIHVVSGMELPDGICDISGVYQIIKYIDNFPSEHINSNQIAYIDVTISSMLTIFSECDHGDPVLWEQLYVILFRFAYEFVDMFNGKINRICVHFRNWHADINDVTTYYTDYVITTPNCVNKIRIHQIFNNVTSLRTSDTDNSDHVANDTDYSDTDDSGYMADYDDDDEDDDYSTDTDYILIENVYSYMDTPYIEVDFYNYDDIDIGM